MRRLLIRPGAIGDVIVSLPVLEWLKTDYTEVWVPTATVPLIQFADKVVSIAASRIDMAGIGHLPVGFSEHFQSFDEVVSWYGSNREALLQINPRCIFHHALPKEARLPATDFYAQQVGAPQGMFPRLHAQNVARETVVIHPFSGSAKKNWPLESFEALTQRLPLPVEWAQDRFESLLDLAEWIAGARLYIGNDSGITHLAAAVVTPVIAIYMNSDPSIWAPHGAHVLRNPTIDEVVATAQSVCARR